MKPERASKIRDLAQGELETRSHSLDEKIFRIRFQAATTQGEGLNNLHALKLERARVKTILRERAAK